MHIFSEVIFPFKIRATESGPGNSVQTAYTDFDCKAPSWGRSDELHYFRKSCCLFDMLNYSKDP